MEHHCHCSRRQNSNVTTVSNQQPVCHQGRSYRNTKMHVECPGWHNLCLLHPDPCAVQRKEDPDTLCGFYKVEVEHTGRTYHVLGLPRDAQGRRLKKNAFARRGGNRAAYYRVMRPASGYSSTDFDAKRRIQVSCTVPQAGIIVIPSAGNYTHTASQECVAWQVSIIGVCSVSNASSKRASCNAQVKVQSCQRALRSWL